MNSSAGSRKARLRSLLNQDEWPLELSSAKGVRGLALRAFRIAQLVVRGFREDDLATHAAALTFSTLVSLVPLLTLAFAMLKGFGGGEEASERLAESIASMPAQFRDFVLAVIDIVMRTNLRTLGWVGVAVLFVTAVQTLSSIEASFNRIWGVRESRSLWRKFTNYTSVIVVVPVLVMTAFAASATLKGFFLSARGIEVGRLSATLLSVAPVAVAWLGFFLLFVFMPNTQVRRRPAAFGALITAFLWIAWQRLYVSMQVSLSRYDAVYGAFASIPIFLLWLYVSWMLILFGAEIAFAIQNHATYHMERMASRASVFARLSLAISLVLEATRALRGDRDPVDLASYAGSHQVPIRMVNEVAGQLARAGMIAERADLPGVIALIRDPDRLRVGHVVHAILGDGAMPESLGPDRMEPALAAALSGLRGLLEDQAQNPTFRSLAEKSA